MNKKGGGREVYTQGNVYSEVCESGIVRKKCGNKEVWVCRRWDKKCT